MRNFFFSLVLFLLPFNSLSQVVINEVLASNNSVIADPQNKAFVDWIELYNSGSGNVDIGGYYLTDDSLVLKKWASI